VVVAHHTLFQVVQPEVLVAVAVGQMLLPQAVKVVLAGVLAARVLSQTIPVVVALEVITAAL
jgi:hypothetical protein